MKFGKAKFRRELSREDMERMSIPERYWGCTVEGVYAEGNPSPRMMVIVTGKRDR